ncbi:MAG: LysM peptidoglycan-binding domain-containing protein [Clostridiales bacterium]|nr:LysM peptidoglycan-binding domain-containing protein [Clostridiales bacterium]
MAYTIQKGDTLSKIAKQNKTTIEELLKLNPYITDPNKISAGKTLALPTDNSGTPSAQTPAQTPTTPIVSNPYDTILKDLEEAYRRQTEAHEASTGALLSELEAGKQTIAQQAYDSTRAASGNYAQAQRVLPEQMARMGLHGTGASETSLVNLGNAYRTTLGDINLAKTQGLQNIDTQKSNVQTQAQQIISSAYSDYINSRANVLLQAQNERLTKESWAQDEKMTRAGWAHQEKMARASSSGGGVQVQDDIGVGIQPAIDNINKALEMANKGISVYQNAQTIQQNQGTQTQQSTQANLPTAFMNYKVPNVEYIRQLSRYTLDYEGAENAQINYIQIFLEQQNVPLTAKQMESFVGRLYNDGLITPRVVEILRSRYGSGYTPAQR